VGQHSHPLAFSGVVVAVVDSTAVVLVWGVTRILVVVVVVVLLGPSRGLCGFHTPLV
jgi:hypothetical protein